MRRNIKVKYLKVGRAMLKLACGGQMHPEWNNIDFSPLNALVKHMFLARILRKIGILSEKRFQRLLKSDPDIIRWDLRKGIPFEDGTFDVIYHSHFLEHFDRKAAYTFMKECYQVLKPSGIIRVVVPDLGIRSRNYVDSLQALSQKECSELRDSEAHKENIQRLIAQMIISEPAGAIEQPHLVRIIEQLIRVDTATFPYVNYIDGWMYDQFTPNELLCRVGFKDIRIESTEKGRIHEWSAFCLDTKENGEVYKRDSI